MHQNSYIRIHNRLFFPISGVQHKVRQLGALVRQYSVESPPGPSRGEASGQPRVAVDETTQSSQSDGMSDADVDADIDVDADVDADGDADIEADVDVDVDVDVDGDVGFEFDETSSQASVNAYGQTRCPLAQSKLANARTGLIQANSVDSLPTQPVWLDGRLRSVGEDKENRPPGLPVLPGPTTSWLCHAPGLATTGRSAFSPILTRQSPANSGSLADSAPSRPSLNASSGQLGQSAFTCGSTRSQRQIAGLEQSTSSSSSSFSSVCLAYMPVVGMPDDDATGDPVAIEPICSTDQTSPTRSYRLRQQVHTASAGEQHVHRPTELSDQTGSTRLPPRLPRVPRVPRASYPASQSSGCSSFATSPSASSASSSSSSSCLSGASFQQQHTRPSLHISTAHMSEAASAHRLSQAISLLGKPSNAFARQLDSELDMYSEDSALDACERHVWRPYLD
ncbi:unnamed protein product [Protopolystoma xenopodis]|uniref:Uncharacterized protein n=1 Tax=Protopolystoma xenopodis TaxID=117903 RepID=A0A448WXA5_9PLAT|nr:unnamed protein product [Protopolystoma xenopodis]